MNRTSRRRETNMEVSENGIDSSKENGSKLEADVDVTSGKGRKSLGMRRQVRKSTKQLEDSTLESEVKEDVTGTNTEEPVDNQLASKKSKRSNSDIEKNSEETEENIDSESLNEVVKSSRGKKQKVANTEVGESENSPKQVTELKEKSPTKTKQTQKAKSKKNQEKIPNEVIDVSTNMPEGWKKEINIRRSGKTAGMIDIYIFSPDGKKFRSRAEVAAYLVSTGSDLKIRQFDFTRKQFEGMNLPVSLETPATNSKKFKSTTKTTEEKNSSQ